MPRRVFLPFVGVILGLAAPAGLVLLRMVVVGSAPLDLWLLHEWQDHHLTYGYLLVVGPLVCGLVGRLLGAQQDSLERHSYADTLTELPNRRYFEDRLSQEVSRAARYGGALALMLIDLDRLKETNDAGGHEAGDVALRAVARSIEQTSRRSDVAARIAGDEFAVLMPGTEAEEALELADRLRGHLHHNARLSVSIGITDFARSSKREQMLRDADRALYAAKRAGRDRAVVAPRPEVEPESGVRPVGRPTASGRGKGRARSSGSK